MLGLLGHGELVLDEFGEVGDDVVKPVEREFSIEVVMLLHDLNQEVLFVGVVYDQQYQIVIVPDQNHQQCNPVQVQIVLEVILNHVIQIHVVLQDLVHDVINDLCTGLTVAEMLNH